LERKGKEFGRIVNGARLLFDVKAALYQGQKTNSGSKMVSVATNTG
jgi:hypothetical protein